MTTISVPLEARQLEFIDTLVKNKKAASKADAVRKAIDMLSEEEAIASVLRAEKELLEGKVLRGDIKKLLKKL